MPDRVFRDEILSSPRYWKMSSDTPRMLFFHLGLRADDLGIFRASNYTIRQECFGADNKPAPEALVKMMSELADADLIRLYSIDGADYGFIPRWRQRLRIVKSRFPLPPYGLRDNAINDLLQKMSDGSQASVGHMSAEVKRSEEKRRERNKVKDSVIARATRLSEEWKLPEEWKQWAVESQDLDPRKVVTMSLTFRDYWIAVPGAKGTKLNWLATWRNWIRREMAHG